MSTLADIRLIVVDSVKDDAGKLLNPGDYDPTFSGTSAACPYAAGTVAALQSAAVANRGATLSPNAVRAILKLTGDPVTDTKVAITKPRINLGAAIAMLTESVPVYAETGCTIDGLVQDVNGLWVLQTGKNNLAEDLCFLIS